MAVRFPLDDTGVVYEVLCGGIVGSINHEVPGADQLLHVAGVYDGRNGSYCHVGIHVGYPRHRAFHLCLSNVLS